MIAKASQQEQACSRTTLLIANKMLCSWGIMEIATKQENNSSLLCLAQTLLFNYQINFFRFPKYNKAWMWDWYCCAILQYCALNLKTHNVAIIMLLSHIHPILCKHENVLLVSLVSVCSPRSLRYLSYDALSSPVGMNGMGGS